MVLHVWAVRLLSQPQEPWFWDVWDISSTVSAAGVNITRARMKPKSNMHQRQCSCEAAGVGKLLIFNCKLMELMHISLCDYNLVPGCHGRTEGGSGLRWLAAKAAEGFLRV